MKRISKRANKLIPYYQDDISVKWLNARERYNEFGDFSIFAETQKEIDSSQKYTINEIMKKNLVVVYRNKNDMVAKYTRRVIQMTGNIKRCKFISEDNCVNSDENIIQEDEVIVPAMEKDEMFDFFIRVRNREDWNRLLIPRPGCLLVGMMGWQYFDLFSPSENEIVVDAGAFDGQTEAEILKWGGASIKKIYAFEANPANFVLCKKYYKDHGLMNQVVFIGKGLWNERTIMYISEEKSSSGSSVGSEGKSAIEVTTIDSEVGDNKVTFIKMDIEGAELNALKGAKATIIKNRPRMAICIYHKPEDIYEIPKYILSIVPEYRFWIRHYASNQWETVLYAKCL